MYRISDSQVDFIARDLQLRGIERESLRDDLVDHICCIIEQNLSEKDDFESYYQKVLPTFCKTEIAEIERETHLLLTNKYLYQMKKLMIFSGAASATLMTAGIIFKFLHLPGAAIMIVLGTGILSFMFLPSLLALKFREQQTASQKSITLLGILAGMLISVGILFKLMHWPGANIMSILAILVMMFLFIPLYFFNGIRKPEFRANTIVSSVLMLTGCLMLLALIRLPSTTHRERLEETRAFLVNDDIAARQRLLAGQANPSAASLDRACEVLKKEILRLETGAESTQTIRKNEIAIGNASLSNLPATPELTAAFDAFRTALADWEKNQPQPTLDTKPILDKSGKVLPALTTLTQIQLLALQQRSEIAMQ